MTKHLLQASNNKKVAHQWRLKKNKNNKQQQQKAEKTKGKYEKKMTFLKEQRMKLDMQGQRQVRDVSPCSVLTKQTQWRCNASFYSNYHACGARSQPTCLQYTQVSTNHRDACHTDSRSSVQIRICWQKPSTQSPCLRHWNTHIPSRVMSQKHDVLECKPAPVRCIIKAVTVEQTKWSWVKHIHANKEMQKNSQNIN